MSTQKANPKGYGAPFARVYHGDKELTHKLSKFVYTMSEDKDDGLEMVFESNDPNMPDDPAFQEHAALSIVWGYINGIQSEKRKVYVREVAPEFTENGVMIKIKASDKLSYLRTGSRLHKNPIDNMTTQDIVNKLAADWGLDRIDPVYFSDGTIGYQVQDIYGLEKPDRIETTVVNEGTDNQFQVETAIFGSAQDNARVFGEFHATLHEGWLPGNRSDFENIKDLLDREPSGPYVMEGRDDKIMIKKRRFDVTPFRTFRYKSDDELIKFNPESKNRTQKSTSVNINLGFMDRENKTYNEQNITELDDDNARLGNIVDGSFSNQPYKRFSKGTMVTEEGDILGTGYSKRTGLDETHHGERGGVNIFSAQTWLVEDKKNPEDAQVILGGGISQTEREGYIGDDGNWKEEIDNTSTQFIPYALLDAREFMEIADDAKDGEIGIDRAKNRRSGAALEKNPGSALIIGDPRIMCGMILTFENVSKKFSGNYYVTTIVHDLDFTRGYTCNITIKRNAINRTGNESPDKITTESINKTVNKKKSVEKKEQTKTVEVNPKNTEEPINKFTNLNITPEMDKYLRSNL